MSSVTYAPFNFDGSTWANKTSGYTIPAGKYANVKTKSALFTINTVQVYPTRNYTASSVSATPIVTGEYQIQQGIHIYSWSQTKTGTAGQSTGGEIGIGTNKANGGTTTDYTSITTTSRTSVGTTTTAVAIDIFVGNLLVISTTPGTGSGSVVTVSAYSLTGQQEFWLPSGTVLGGANYDVIEYTSIT